MAQTITKEILSGSTDGKLIKVVATATPGTTIHATQTYVKDDVFLYATNTDTSAHKLTIEWGGQTAPDDLIEVTIAAESGVELIVPGLVLTNGLVVTAFADTTNVINIGGYVERVS
ncbi:MAG: hypothetical protein ACTSP4_00490 [Candidatus Hodarchaeales archaeon]